MWQSAFEKILLVVEAVSYLDGKQKTAFIDAYLYESIQSMISRHATHHTNILAMPTTDICLGRQPWWPCNSSEVLRAMQGISNPHRRSQYRTVLVT